MNSYLLAEHLLQYALNALISFFLFAFITEGVMRVLKIRSPRLRASLMLIPLTRLVIEPFFTFLHVGPFMINASIFSCSHPLQRFLYGTLQVDVRQELSAYGLKTVSGSYLLMLPIFLINAAVAVVMALTLYKVVVLVVQYVKSIARIKEIRKRGSVNARPIFAKKLQEQLQKQQTQIVISNEVQVPISVWGNAIIIPASLVDEYTQPEFETVISHELEHHRWYDTMVRTFCYLIAAVYWWVPMTPWLNKLENEQEMASDISVYRYELKGLDLATALQKTVKRHQHHHYKCAAFLKHASSKGGQNLLDRIEAVLNPSMRLNQNRIAALIGMIIMFGFTSIFVFVIC